MKFKRNSMVIAVVSLLLCLAVYLNWSYSQSLENADSAAALSDQEVAEILGEEAVQVSAEPISDADRFAQYQWVIAGAESDAISTLSQYFAQTRLSRQQSKDEAVSLLQETLASEAVSADARSDAETSLNAIAAYTLTESRIESLVLSKGFPECVAIVDENGVSVIVQPPEAELVAADVAKITDIVLTEAQVTADQIRVVQAG